MDKALEATERALHHGETYTGYTEEKYNTWIAANPATYRIKDVRKTVTFTAWDDSCDATLFPSTPVVKSDGSFGYRDCVNVSALFDGPFSTELRPFILQDRPVALKCPKPNGKSFDKKFTEIIGVGGCVACPSTYSEMYYKTRPTITTR